MQPLDRLSGHVLSCYGAAVDGLRWVPIGSGGGFSGAALWRGEDPAGHPLFALKSWPGDVTFDQLQHVHHLMRRAERLAFVPRVLLTTDGASAVRAAGRAWDIASWMPGRADFHARPTDARLANVCVALAELHRAWAFPPLLPTPCPGVHRRLAVLADFAATLPARASAKPIGYSELDEPLRHGHDAVRRLAPSAVRSLASWIDRTIPVQPCLCDVWHDHLLFIDDVVSGVIDYGATKVDHPAVDLARLLGDLVGDDEVRFAAGLDAYARAGGVPEPAPGFARLLDRTGAVCAAAVWLRRLSVERRAYPDLAAVARRVAAVVARITSFATV